MNTHLDDEQIAAVIIGAELERAAADHLESCLDCRRRVASMEELMALRRQRMATDEPDWDLQLAAVMDRLPADDAARPSRRSSWIRPLMAAAAALLVVVVVGMLGPDQPEIVSNGTDIAVEEILAEMDEILADDSIPGFEVIDPGMEELESYLSAGAS